MQWPTQAGEVGKAFVYGILLDVPNLAKASFTPVRKYPTVFRTEVGVSSTPSARVRRATIAARERGVAPGAPWAWGDRRSRIREASTESGRPVVRQNVWGKRRRL